jgi:uncharacterized membrane protein
VPGRRPGLGSRLALVVTLMATSSVQAASDVRVDATVYVVPLAISLDVSPDEAAVGKPVKVRAIVTNTGTSTLTAVAVAVRFDPVGLVVVNGTNRTIARLATGRSASVSWQVRGEAAGVFVLLARASLGSASVESEARLLTITPRR